VAGFQNQSACVRPTACDGLDTGGQSRGAHASGHLAIGCYIYDPTEHAFDPHCNDILTQHGEKIGAVTGFLVADFPRFDLPVEAE